MEVQGNILRYFINRTGSVAFDILNASGRVLHQVPALKCAQGWHQIGLGAAAMGDTRGNGVYFVRCAVDGASLGVKRVVMIR